jgi:NADPH:quinone reductase-like Zn-dependent oxidoreductase
MTTLVLGATGATGRLAVQQLLAKGEHVKALVRSKARLTPWINNLEHLTVVETEITELTIEQWQQHLEGVDAVVSCLGHNLTFKGIYGHPRRLVTDVVARIHQAVERLAPAKPVRYVLMNTTGVKNPELNEQHSMGEKIVIGLLRHVLPPQADNEDAAHYLRTQVGQDNRFMTWVAVRPDGLVDDAEVSTYVEEPSPLRSPIFDAGKTSRINVGNFMMRLITEERTWQQWQGKTPVLYNAG